MYAIVEMKSTGHRFEYVAHLIEHCLEAGHEFVLCSSENVLRSKTARVWLDPLLGTNDCPKVLKLRGESQEEALDQVAGLGYSSVVLPDADRLVLSIGEGRYRLPRGMHLTALMLRSPVVYKQGSLAKDVAKRTLLKRALRRSPSLRVCHLVGPSQSRSTSSNLVTDPAPPLTGATDYHQHLPDEVMKRTKIGILGGIDKRKNVPWLVESVGSALGPRSAILFSRPVNELDAPSRLSIGKYRSKGGIALFPAEQASESEFVSLMLTSDCVLIANNNPGPSGILIRATQVRTMAVVLGNPALQGDAVALGQLWVRRRRSELSRALMAVQEEPWVPHELSKSTTSANFARSLLGCCGASCNSIGLR